MRDPSTRLAPPARIGGAALAICIAGCALAVAAAAALWASEGARVFVEAAFSAVLACL